MLRACADPPPLSLVPACDSVTAANGSGMPRLCEGLRTIHRAPCTALGDLAFLISVIEKIGLVPDVRRDRLYGSAVVHMIPGHSSTKGLWQEPQQIAGAMLSVASRMRVATYVEVGVFTAWTTTVMAAYLRRVIGHGPFQGWAVDITSSHITSATRRMLGDLNVSFVPRKQFDPQRFASQFGAARAGEGRLLDLCFIDGDHSYAGVRSDYAAMGRFCRAAMFHDIRDTSCLGAADFSGGVPLFWQHLKRHLPSEARSTELTRLSSTFLPMFGIGIVWPGPAGTAEADAAVSEWRPWKGGGASKLWVELCGNHGAVGVHPVCNRSVAADLQVFVRATKRSVKKEDLVYASAKWYGRPAAGASPRAGAPTKKQLKLNGKVAALATVGIADPGLV